MLFQNKTLFLTSMLIGAVMSQQNPSEEAAERQGGIPIPRPGSPDYEKNFFQYINVPAPKIFEWGYRRGNDPDHFREEYLSQKDHTFKAKVKWGDQYEGYGEHFFDYNHGPKYNTKHHEPHYISKN